MNEWLLNNKELISVYMSILGTVFTIIGAIAIPVVLWCWSSRDQKRKEERLEKNKKEEEMIKEQEKKWQESKI